MSVISITGVIIIVHVQLHVQLLPRWKWIMKMLTTKKNTEIHCLNRFHGMSFYQNAHNITLYYTGYEKNQKYLLLCRCIDV